MNIFGDNIKVWNETKEYVEKNKLYAKKSIKFINLDIQFDYKDNLINSDIHVVQMDTIDAGIKLKENGYNPVILNMCDWSVPGGIIDAGSVTQEEDLFRRSNYYTTLTKDLYPLKDIDTIFSSNVLVFKENAFVRYRMMEEPIYLNFIAAPAPFKPIKDNNRFKNESDINLFKNKMRMLFKIAYVMNCDSIVLSAWGCGVFYCPSEHTAELFNEIINEFKGMFKIIVFAIIGKGENYNIFSKTINKE